MKENNSISLKKMQKQLQIPYMTVRRLVDGLQKDGIVIREGSKRCGQWIVKI